MMKRNRSFPLPLPHNDSLPGMRSVKDAIESRGGIFSGFKDSANKISASVFMTKVGAVENPNGKTGLNRQATTQEAATQRYSRTESASKPNMYPTA